METPIIVAVISAIVALTAAAVSLLSARGNSSREAFELARRLYADLTSKETSAHRSALEFYRRKDPVTPAETKQAMNDYFALLWQFEQILAGRESLKGQERLNGTQKAVKFLDHMIKWHVEVWAKRWDEVREKIQKDLPQINTKDPILDDHHSVGTFCDLADAVIPGNTAVWNLRTKLRTDPGGSAA
ncbi:hypothetical protein [Streptomyces natalensis]|uniref:Uncharacterized protein n=1 Tax=Streptomyces natalensis ATCC 27448 TaxID=1240678 RepID=A0A0D7CPZ5_9ACTN|nr:hypothetical protein [Streptomyces natalensis]KIZ18136.1 hypothetical protein SNA_08940 [Streptomyces natalensis ATCC 27448]